MELKEFLAIYRKRANLFGAVMLAALACGALFYFFQPVRYRSAVLLNVTRTGQAKTADYQFDDFYRLQADERFADTIVRWLESQRFQADLQKKVATERVFSLSAKRLSSQTIAVDVFSAEPVTTERLALAIEPIVNDEAAKLNQWQQKENWFRVAADAPLTGREMWRWEKILLLTLGLGIFTAFWLVLIRHYWE